MESIPGVGLASVRIGQRREEVVAALGEPSTDDGRRAWYHGEQPAFSVLYDGDDAVELVEVGIASVSWRRDGG